MAAVDCLERTMFTRIALAQPVRMVTRSWMGHSYQRIGIIEKVCGHKYNQFGGVVSLILSKRMALVDGL